MFRSPPSERHDAVKMQPKSEPAEVLPKLNDDPVKPETPENRFVFFCSRGLVSPVSFHEGRGVLPSEVDQCG